MKKRTARKLEYFLHIITAIALLLKGFSEIGKGLLFPGFIISGLAITVLAIMFLWKLLQIRPKDARVVCYYLESPALLITAYLLSRRENEAAYIFFIAALLYPLAGFVSSRRFKRLNKT